MAADLAQRLIEYHLVSGEMQAGEEIAMRVDQTLTQDATGPRCAATHDGAGWWHDVDGVRSEWTYRKTGR